MAGAGKRFLNFISDLKNRQGQPWFMPAIWPTGNIYAAVTKPENETAKKLETKPIIA